MSARFMQGRNLITTRWNHGIEYVIQHVSIPTAVFYHIKFFCEFWHVVVRASVKLYGWRGAIHIYNLVAGRYPTVTREPDIGVTHE